MKPSVCSNAALRRAARQLGQLYDDMLAPSGLRGTQFSLLSQIALHDGPSMGALADVMVMDRSALGHTLGPLTRDGLVTLVADPADRRSKRVMLTPAGKDRLTTARALWRQAQTRFETAFGPDDPAAFRAVLDRVSSRAFADAFTGAEPQEAGTTRTTASFRRSGGSVQGGS